jgi:cephalosporin hydroxylase
MKTRGLRNGLRRALEAGAEVRQLPQLRQQMREQMRELRRENKRLKEELRARKPEKSKKAAPAQPPGVSTLRPPAAGEEAETVERFHLLYRDGKRIDKDTWWRGARVIKCPLDLWIYQELIFELEPDLIIETGTMYGGSAFYFASLLDLLGKGEVVTIDKNLREGRPEHPRITYLTGSSTADRMVQEARRRAEGKRVVLVLLDSNHKARHVLDELRAYHGLVTAGSYLVIEDTNINGHPVEPDFGPGPMEALQSFLEENSDFEVDTAREKFLLTFNPHGWLRRKVA